MGLVSRRVDETLSITWRLDVAADATWRHLVDLGTWREWIGSPIEGSLGHGGTIVVDHGEGYLCTNEIEIDDAARRLVMTWTFPDEHPTWLQLTVSPRSDGGTTVVLDHHDLGDLVDSYALGWLVHLTYFEASVSGSPLPSTEFWHLHQTFEALTSETPPGP